MSPFRTGFKIWGIAVFINGLYFGFFSLIVGDFFSVLLSVLVMFGGAFAGIPFLILLVQLLRIAKRLPYSMTARITWLSSLTILGVWMFYSAVFYMISNEPVFSNPFMWQVSGITIAAFITSMWFT